jgi:tRNA (guanine37-N1)-methyltransferase
VNFHVISIFPDFFQGMLSYGVLGRAIESGVVKVTLHNLRDWTFDRHKTVDDRPFGGGEGMLMKAEPIFAAVESIWPEGSNRAGRKAVLLSAQGRRFDQAVARRLAEADELLLICGRYEGVDERVSEHLVDEELSIGDFVLSGGELAAAVVMDSVARLIPGVVGNEASTVWESFTRRNEAGQSLLDCPQYTRPAVFRGWAVPEVLLSGNHEEIRKWREQAASAKTRRNRPDMLAEDIAETEIPLAGMSSGNGQ